MSTYSRYSVKQVNIETGQYLIKQKMLNTHA